MIEDPAAKSAEADISSSTADIDSDEQIVEETGEETVEETSEEQIEDASEIVAEEDLTIVEG